MNGYTSAQRRVEGVALAACVAAGTVAAARLVRGLEAPDLPFAVAAFVLAWFAADFLSGLVHWACDTWGDVGVPIVGNGLIRGFREHHADPEAITRHDFVETNGAVALVTLPLLVAAGPAAAGGAGARLAATVLVSLAGWLVLTNQIHLWAHHPSPPRIVRALQHLGLLLRPGHHAHHHRAPFVGNYCITSGWWNRPLAAVGFFTALERAVERTTGARPRACASARSEAGAVRVS